MLRLFETRTGQVVGVRPGPLRLYVQQPDDLRVCLMADVLRRLAPRLRRPTLTTAAHDADHSSWNIPPLHAGEPLPGSLSVGNVTSETRVNVADWSAFEADPLAVRLALLGVHYRTEARLSPETVSEAETRLAGWRARVATWGAHPSKAVDKPIVDKAVEAFCDDLNVPAVIDLLDYLTTTDLPPGAKFETALLLDLILGLDLVRYLGTL